MNDQKLFEQLPIPKVLSYAHEGNLKALQNLKEHLDDEFDVNGTDLAGMTLLHMATQNGHIDTALWLGKVGADINAKLDSEQMPDFGDFTPLFLAIHKHGPKCNMMPLIQFLLSHPELDITTATTKDKCTVLMFAIRWRKIDVIEAIVLSPQGNKIFNTPSATSFDLPYSKCISLGLTKSALLLKENGANTVRVEWLKLANSTVDTSTSNSDTETDNVDSANSSTPGLSS
jgi:hypothetical protein